MKKLIIALFALLAITVHVAAQTTPFTTFAYPGTGTNNVTRTSPARIADERNVKDYGATGVGTGHDDSTAIANALGAACADGSTSDGGTTGGSVYFPPGQYWTGDKQISLFLGNCTVKIRGSSRDGARVFGNIPGDTCSACTLVTSGGTGTLTVAGTAGSNWKVGYAIRGHLVPRDTVITANGSGSGGNGTYTIACGDCGSVSIGAEAMEAVGCAMSNQDAGSGDHGVVSITDLTIANTNATSGCGLKFDAVQQGHLEGLTIDGFYALIAATAIYNTGFINSRVNCPPNIPTGSTGIFSGQLSIVGVTVTGCYIGLSASSTGLVWTGSRIEQGYYGMVLGINFNGDQDTLSASALNSTSFEATYIGIWALSVTTSHISSMTITSAVNEVKVPDTGKQTLSAAYCMVLSSLQDVIIDGINGNCNPWAGGIDLIGSLTGGNTTFSNVVINGTEAGIGPAAACTGCSISGNVLTVAGSTADNWGVGYTLAGSGIPGGTTIIDGPGGGAHGNGAYTISASLGTIGAEAMTAAPSGSNWNMATAKQIAGIAFIGSGNPVPPLLFHDLPGQSGFSAPPNPVNGMTFFITDSQVNTLGLAAFGNGSYAVTVTYNNGTWNVVSANTNEVLFSTLPTMNLASMIGAEFNVSDCTIGGGGAWGGTVTGGGGVHCKTRWNGTNWTAMGK